MKLTRPVKILIAILIIAVIAIGGCELLKRPSLRYYESTFGFSLKGIKTNIYDHYHEEAWQDPWSAYAVTATGTLSGSIFDKELMEEGLSLPVKNVLELLNKDYAAAGRGPVFAPQQDGHYKSRIITTKGAASGRERLIIISDQDLWNNYYIIYLSW